jgi:large conductance mechanosensitive channel
MSQILKEFRDFVLRGNVIDLAVAVVIGAAFTAVVNAIVSGLVTPLVAAVIGQPSFEGLTFTINGSDFKYGIVLNALITFVSVAAVVFFLIVKPMNEVMERLKPHHPVDKPTHPCPECLSEIPKAATRCAFCTAQVTPAAPGGASA